MIIRKLGAALFFTLSGQNNWRGLDGEGGSCAEQAGG